MRGGGGGGGGWKRGHGPTFGLSQTSFIHPSEHFLVGRRTLVSRVQSTYGHIHNYAEED